MEYDLTRAMAEKEGIDVEKVSQTALAKAEQYTPLKKSLDGTALALGTVTSFGESVTAVNAPLKTLAAQLPLFGTALTSVIDWATNATTIKLTTGETAIPDQQHDALIMNDGLIKFNPADKFMQVNDSTMIAGTNVDGNKKLARAIGGSGGSIDYNKLASAIASAMQHVTVQATVKTDNLFGPTSLNTNKRKFR